MPPGTGEVPLTVFPSLPVKGIVVVAIGLDSELRLVVSGPDIVTRGFVFVRESEELIEEAKQTVMKTIERCYDRNIRDWSTIKNRVRDDISKLMYERTKRSPMVLPILLEIDA